MAFDLFFYCVTVKTIYDCVVSVGQLSFGCRSYSGRSRRMLCKRVPNRFFEIRDLAYFKAGIRDFEGKGGRDSGL